MKADISNFDDVKLFVDEFYKKVQADDLIGLVFSGVITDWGPHLEKMYLFWNTALFSVPGFKGSPFAKHAPLQLQKQHFDRWIMLFKATIDTYFEGEMATSAKNKAELMAALFLSKIENMTGGPSHLIV